MGIEIVASLVAGLASMVAGVTVSTELIQKLIRRVLGQEPKPKPFAERIGALTESLNRASREVDHVLSEVAELARERQGAVEKLETDLQTLEKREQELKKQIQDLEEVPVPVADHFAKMLQENEKRSAWRDYLLFGGGVVVTTIVAVAIQLIMGGG